MDFCILTFGVIKTWQKRFLVKAFSIKYTLKQAFQLILRVYVIMHATLYKRKYEYHVFAATSYLSSYSP